MYKLQCLGDFYSFHKGLGYLGKYLAPSQVALVGLNSFEGGGGYKHGGEKEYSGPYKVDHVAYPGDLFISTTDITQDGRVLASPFLMPDLMDKYEQVIYSGDIVKAVPKKEGLSPEFLYNVLRVKFFRQKAAYASTGSTVRRIPVEVLERLEVPVPPKEIQDAIANHIELIDRKIETNFRIAVDLEQIAQTCFQSWFVDFDPVHAKSRGLEPEGLDIDTAGLFPDAFQESDLGDIPKGFTQVRFDSFCEVLLGGTPSKSKPDYWDGSIPWINSGAINDYRIVEATRFITELGLGNSSCKLLPKGTTVIAITGATLGQFSRVEIETTANQSVIGIRPFDNAFKDYVYLWVSKNIGLLTAKSTGGAQQHINRNDVCEQFVLLPPPELALKFSQVMEPIFESISNLLFQNLTLVRLRDSLLPRLVSGDLGISDEILGE